MQADRGQLVLTQCFAGCDDRGDELAAEPLRVSHRAVKVGRNPIEKLNMREAQRPVYGASARPSITLKKFPITASMEYVTSWSTMTWMTGVSANRKSI